MKNIKKYYLKSGEVRYCATLCHQNRRIDYRSFSRKVDAESWLRREKLRLEDEKVGRLKGHSITFHDFFRDVYWPNKQLRESTAIDYEAVFRKHLNPEFGDKVLTELETESFSRFFNKLVERGSTKSRVNKIHAIASAILSMAVRFNYLSSNPVRDIPHFERPNKKFDYWSFEEVGKFLSTLKENHNPRFALYLLAYETGMRRGEIQALSRQAIDFETNTINVYRTYCGKTKKITDNTKGGGARSIGMSFELRNLLKDICDSHTYDLVFCRKDGKGLPHDYLRYHFEKDQKMAGVRRITFHNIRHTFGSHFVMKDGSLYDLQALLGHEDHETTQRYAHLAKDHVAKKATLVSFEQLKIA